VSSLIKTSGGNGKLTPELFEAESIAVTDAPSVPARSQVDTRLAEIAHLIKTVDALDAAGANEQQKRQQLRQQALELASAGAPDCRR
jgi:hypothetical protein